MVLGVQSWKRCEIIGLINIYHSIGYSGSQLGVCWRETMLVVLNLCVVSRHTCVPQKIKRPSRFNAIY